LAFAVVGEVERLDDGGAFALGVGEMGVDIGDEDGEALGGGAELGGSGAAGAGAAEHDPGVAEVHLGAGGAAVIASVAIVLEEAEGAGEPVDGLGDVFVDDVREEDVGGDGGVGDHFRMVEKKKDVRQEKRFNAEKEKRRRRVHGDGMQLPATGEGVCRNAPMGA